MPAHLVTVLGIDGCQKHVNFGGSFWWVSRHPIKLKNSDVASAVSGGAFAPLIFLLFFILHANFENVTAKLLNFWSFTPPEKWKKICLPPDKKFALLHWTCQAIFRMIHKLIIHLTHIWQHVNQPKIDIWIVKGYF